MRPLLNEISVISIDLYTDPWNYLHLFCVFITKGIISMKDRVLYLVWSVSLTLERDSIKRVLKAKYISSVRDEFGMVGNRWKCLFVSIYMWLLIDVFCFQISVRWPFYNQT